MAKQIIEWWLAGLITDAELHQRLEALQIRGGISSDRTYVGYDYGAQQWVTSH